MALMQGQQVEPRPGRFVSIEKEEATIVPVVDRLQQRLRSSYEMQEDILRDITTNPDDADRIQFLSTAYADIVRIRNEFISQQQNLIDEFEKRLSATTSENAVDKLLEQLS